GPEKIVPFITPSINRIWNRPHRILRTPHNIKLSIAPDAAKANNLPSVLGRPVHVDHSTGAQIALVSDTPLNHRGVRRLRRLDGRARAIFSTTPSTCRLPSRMYSSPTISPWRAPTWSLMIALAVRGKT